jgi:hypothetical protein
MYTCNFNLTHTSKQKLYKRVETENFLKWDKFVKNHSTISTCNFSLILLSYIQTKVRERKLKISSRQYLCQKSSGHYQIRSWLDLRIPLTYLVQIHMQFELYTYSYSSWGNFSVKNHRTMTEFDLHLHITSKQNLESGNWRLPQDGYLCQKSSGHNQILSWPAHSFDVSTHAIWTLYIHPNKR